MTELKCDFDGAIPDDFGARVACVTGMHRLRLLWRRDDRTAHGWHVTLAVAQRVALPRVICLQAILGSDWKREAFNSARVLHWRGLPPLWRARINVLYQRHYRGVRV